jgi:hypothetical protein
MPAGSYTRRRRWSATEARAVVAAMEASGLSPQAFAAREGLQVQRLWRWRGRVGSEAASKAGVAAFVELGQHAAAGSRIEIALRSGRTLHVQETIDPVALRRIIDVLEHDARC